MAARLQLLRSRRAKWPAQELRPGPQPDPAEIQAAAALLSRGPVTTRVNPSAARSLLRQSALRVMSPYTSFEQQVDAALLERYARPAWADRVRPDRS